MIVGRSCAALYKGQWLRGIIVKHNIKCNICTIETKEIGTIKVHSFKIRLDRPDWED